MNYEKLFAIVDSIRAEKIAFDMSTWTSNQCVTGACIAGHAVYNEINSKSFNEFWDYICHEVEHLVLLGEMSVHVIAADILDMSIDDSRELFGLNLGWDESTRELITAEQAINTIHRLIVTGEVDWSKRDEPVLGTQLADFLPLQEHAEDVPIELCEAD